MPSPWSLVAGSLQPSTLLASLVLSLDALQRDWQVAEAVEERCDAAALRLQSFQTGIERCFVQIVRVLNGGPPDGGGNTNQSSAVGCVNRGGAR